MLLTIKHSLISPPSQLGNGKECYLIDVIPRLRGNKRIPAPYCKKKKHERPMPCVYTDIIRQNELVSQSQFSLALSRLEDGILYPNGS